MARRSRFSSRLSRVALVSACLLAVGVWGQVVGARAVLAPPPPLSRVEVPVFKLDPRLPRPASTVPPNARVMPAAVAQYIYDIPAIEAGRAALSALPPLAPASQVVGTGNAYAATSHEVVPPNTTAAFYTLFSGFDPHETVVYSISGFPPVVYTATSGGEVVVLTHTGASTGPLVIKAQGVTSGEIAGAIVTVSPYASVMPGVAVMRHANYTDGFLIALAGYPPSSAFDAMVDDAVVGSQMTSGNGTALWALGFPAGPSIGLVLGAERPGVVGSAVGRSVEFRADAGPNSPRGDRNLARAYLGGSAVYTSAVALKEAVGLEGFVAGETVSVTFGTLYLGSFTTDSSGAGVFAFVTSTGSADGMYKFTIQGMTSGRLAYAGFRIAPLATNAAPGMLVMPSRYHSGADPATVFMDRLPAGTTGAFYSDGGFLGTGVADSQGFTSIALPPANTPLVHNVTYSGTTNTMRSAAAYMLNASGILSGTITDAFSGLPIKARIAVGTGGDVLVMSNPAVGGGGYSQVVAPGTYTVTVTGDGCYAPQTFSNLVISPDSVTTLHVELVRSAADAFGYQCYRMALGITPAGNLLFGNTFDEERQTINLPFPVTLYGTTYTTGTIGANGWMTIGNDPGNALAANGCLPNAAVPNNLLAPGWDDLQGVPALADSGVYTELRGTAPNRTYVVEWRSFRHAGDTVTNTMQLWIREGSPHANPIYFAYPTFRVGDSDGRAATLGIENRTGLIGKQVECNISVPTDATNFIFAGEVMIFAGPLATPTPTNSPTPTDTPMPTNTPTPSATPCGAAEAWLPGANFPSNIVRGAGVWYPPNGRFYVIGGRTSDDVGFELTHPVEYDPANNTWITKTATYLDNRVGNLVATVLSGPSGPRIYLVGGAVRGGGFTDAVYSYDPVADTITQITTDSWTPGLGQLPGGFAVASNKLYLFGGFTGGGVTNAIWEFDPNRPNGSKWALKTAILPVALGYIPANTINGIIYMAGGSTWNGTALADSNNSYRYDPVTDALTTIAVIPRMTGETRAVVKDGHLWVLGGGHDAPNPSNAVDSYDPGTNTWTTGLPFVITRRNFPVDLDPATNTIYLVGGYINATPALTNTMELYHAAIGCGTVTPTPTATLTLTPSSTPTATACVPGDTGYAYQSSTGSTLAPGTASAGSACDDCVVAITLPFTYTLYNNTFTTVNASSNGNLQFTSTATAFANACLPSATLNNAILPLWDDLRTDAQAGCANNPSGVCGIYTSISGSAPNRIFNIEWRAVYFTGGAAVNFEVRLHESGADFDILYGPGSDATSATLGVQKDIGSKYTQAACNAAGAVTAGTQHAYSLIACGSTNTPMATATLTETPTDTPTATATAVPVPALYLPAVYFNAGAP